MDMRHTPFFFVIFAGLNINEIIAVYYDSLNLMINSNNKLQHMMNSLQTIITMSLSTMSAPGFEP